MLRYPRAECSLVDRDVKRAAQYPLASRGKPYKATATVDAIAGHRPTLSLFGHRPKAHVCESFNPEACTRKHISVSDHKPPSICEECARPCLVRRSTSTQTLGDGGIAIARRCPFSGELDRSVGSQSVTKPSTAVPTMARAGTKEKLTLQVKILD